MSVLVVVEASPESLAAVIADARSAGWHVVPGWSLPDLTPDLVMAGTVSTEQDARAAVLAVVAGAGLIARAEAARDVTDRLCDDLRRFGALDHRVGDDPAADLSADERRLLDLLADGMTLGQAANRLHLSRRSADRRLASARRRLDVATSGEAVISYRDRLDRIGRPGR